MDAEIAANAQKIIAAARRFSTPALAGQVDEVSLSTAPFLNAPRDIRTGPVRTGSDPLPRSVLPSPSATEATVASIERVHRQLERRHSSTGPSRVGAKRADSCRLSDPGRDGRPSGLVNGSYSSGTKRRRCAEGGGRSSPDNGALGGADGSSGKLDGSDGKLDGSDGEDLGTGCVTVELRPDESQPELRPLGLPFILVQSSCTVRNLHQVRTFGGHFVGGRGRPLLMRDSATHASVLLKILNRLKRLQFLNATMYFWTLLVALQTAIKNLIV